MQNAVLIAFNDIVYSSEWNVTALCDVQCSVLFVFFIFFSFPLEMQKKRLARRVYIDARGDEKQTIYFFWPNGTCARGAVPAFPYSAFNCFFATNFATFYGRRFCYVSPDWSK